MRVVFKILNNLKNFWLQITIILSSLCFGFLLLNVEKLIINPLYDFTPVDLMLNKITALPLVFFFISLTMLLLNISGYKTFSKETINNYVSWFLTAISTALTYSLYWITASIYKALHFEEPKDLLYKSKFFEINRLWSHKELAFNASRCAEQMGVSLSNQEIEELCSNSTTIETLYDKTRELCLQKLIPVPSVPDVDKGWEAYFSDIFNTATAFASDHKALCIALGLISGIAVYALLQNFAFQATTKGILDSNSESIEILSSRIDSIGTLNDSRIDNIDQISNDNIQRTDDAISILKIYIKNQVQNINLNHQVNMASLQLLTKDLENLIRTVDALGRTVSDEEKMIRYILACLMKKGLLPSSSSSGSSSE